MRLLVSVCALIVVLPDFCAAQPTLSEDCYWERPVLKGRSAARVEAYGEAMVNDEPVPFYDSDLDDSGLTVIAPDNGPGSTQLISNAGASAGIGTTYGDGEASGGVSFNSPLQAVAEASLMTVQSAMAGVNPDHEFDDWSWVDYSHFFVMEATHKLASATVPSGTLKPCVCKIKVDWNRSGLGFEPLLCDWVIVGFPGEPVVSTDTRQGFVCVSYTVTYPGQEEEEYVEVCSTSLDDPTGGIYVDIPGSVGVGDEVTWISSLGSGSWNFGHGGHVAGSPELESASAIVEALLQLEVHDEE